MMIHSVSYEAGQKELGKPTENDRHDWLDILKQGLTLKMNWPEQYSMEIATIIELVQQPKILLPSFNRDSFYKPETTMQENLFKILGNTCKASVNTCLPELKFDFETLNQVS